MAVAGRRPADLVPYRVPNRWRGRAAVPIRYPSGYQTVEGGGGGIGRRPGIGPKDTTGYQTTAREGTKSFIDRRSYQTVPCVQVPFGTMRTEFGTLRGARGGSVSRFCCVSCTQQIYQGSKLWVVRTFGTLLKIWYPIDNSVPY